ncbi:MAG: hypothetical protein J6X54_07415 [Treponema sp.]|nr:hypothetical protein [Treponema sp.]
MKNMKKIFLALSLLFVFSTGSLFAGSFFSANVGGMLSYNPDVAQTEYDPNLKLNAYIESQFNFADNIWSHFNFSLKTDDFLSVDLFSETDSKFRIDEISVIIKSPIEASTNYFGVYMGAYDPIGSDLFFQRYFGLLPTSSVLTKSWLGQAGSILYPHFGIGIADVVKLHNYPLAFGLYAYVNNEDEKYYVFNADLRFGAVYRYFAIDIAGGLGAPLSDKYNGEGVIVVVDKLYWHAGTTILIGNNYTQSLYLQAGIFNASFTKDNDALITDPDHIYFLVEPRFRFKNTHMNISAWSIPKECVDNFIYVSDTLGASVVVYNDTLSWGSHQINLGTIFSLSFPNKTFLDLASPLQLFVNRDFNVDITPYLSTNLLSGEIHFQSTIRIMEFLRNNWYNGITFEVGYKTSL